MPDAPQRQYPSITNTVYGVDEIQAMDAKLMRNVATCSEPDVHNRGCHRWDDCQWPWKGKRPQQVAVCYHHGDGRIVNRDDLCRGVEDQRIKIEGNGGFIEILAYEGEDYDFSGSRRLHPVPKPLECQACRIGQCLTYEDFTEKRTVPAHPEAIKDKRLLMFARATHARRERMTQREAAAKHSFYGNEPETPPRTEAPDAGSGNQPEAPEPAGSGPGGPGRKGAGKGGSAPA